MCFYHDYDWYAKVNNTDEHAVKDKDVKCDECHRIILAGKEHVIVHMEENDPDEDSEEDEDGSIIFDPGETFDYDCCLDCWKLRKAIRKSEEEAGCSGETAEPAYLELVDAMREGEGERYASKAREMFPGLNEGYLSLVGPYKDETES